MIIITTEVCLQSDQPFLTDTYIHYITSIYTKLNSYATFKSKLQYICVVF
jgi:hypothetical protein